MFYVSHSVLPSALKLMNSHLSVMLNEVVALLTANQETRHADRTDYLDCTFGGGGHSRALLESAPTVHLLALDCDPQAQARAAVLAQDFPARFRFDKRNFSQLEGVQNVRPFQGILFDLGVSSFQLDAGERGFSFREDAPVDMRLDPTCGRSGAEFLENASEQELIVAVRDYAEEPRWRRVVQTLLRARGTGQLRSTLSLAALVAQAAGQGRPSRIHPATRTFQGIRIAVNDELRAIETALPAAWSRLSAGGVLAVLSFHSLEDRIIKRFFRRMAGLPEHASDHACSDTRTVQGTLLTRRPLSPTQEELSHNPRARSARLRAIKKGIPS